MILYSCSLRFSNSKPSFTLIVETLTLTTAQMTGEIQSGISYNQWPSIFVSCTTPRRNMEKLMLQLELVALPIFSLACSIRTRESRVWRSATFTWPKTPMGAYLHRSQGYHDGWCTYYTHSTYCVCCIRGIPPFLNLYESSNIFNASSSSSFFAHVCTQSTWDAAPGGRICSSRSLSWWMWIHIHFWGIFDMFLYAAFSENEPFKTLDAFLSGGESILCKALKIAVFRVYDCAPPPMVQKQGRFIECAQDRKR